jgi:hypothetical protein
MITLDKGHYNVCGIITFDKRDKLYCIHYKIILLVLYCFVQTEVYFQVFIICALSINHYRVIMNQRLITLPETRAGSVYGQVRDYPYGHISFAGF